MPDLPVRAVKTLDQTARQTRFKWRRRSNLPAAAASAAAQSQDQGGKPVTLRTTRLWAALAGAAIGGAALAAEPAKLPAVKSATKLTNQQLADEVVNKLTTTGSAFGADVSMQCVDGVVTLTGTCKDAATKDRIIADVRVVPGVQKVRDGLSVGSVQPVQATLPSAPMGPVASPVLTSQMPASSGPMIEPQAMGAPNMMGSAELNAPPLPPNAWPTYAPYNNVSRVAYPQAYPYNAFPFIGPYYPFPKVPLGWRKVTLEWEDGHWWYGRLQTPNDYWRVRFW